MKQFTHLTHLIVAALILTVVQSASAQSNELSIDGFIEPFRRIELSSDETGAISEMLVEEGDQVQRGDVVAKLDCRLQEIQLEIAKKIANSTSQRQSAANTLKKRRVISERLSNMQQQGHASESEIIRGDLELSIAEANYYNTVEEASVREVEMRRASMQLEKRTVRVPFSGVIASISRREGEFLSPLHPEICTLVQVDKLLASFNVDSQTAKDFYIGQERDLRLSDGSTVQAIVHSVGIEINPQSGTVEIKFVINNEDYKIRSGDRCSLNV